jgi:hypothetical protein
MRRFVLVVAGLCLLVNVPANAAAFIKLADRLLTFDEPRYGHAWADYPGSHDPSDSPPPWFSTIAGEEPVCLLSKNSHALPHRRRLGLEIVHSRSSTRPPQQHPHSSPALPRFLLRSAHTDSASVRGRGGVGAATGMACAEVFELIRSLRVKGWATYASADITASPLRPVGVLNVPDVLG